MNAPDPGHKKGESKEEGMRRRKKEGDRKSHKLWLEIQKAEKEKNRQAREFIESALPNYEEIPL